MTFDALGIAGTGLTLHRKWLDAVSDNLSNVSTVRSTDDDAQHVARDLEREDLARCPATLDEECRALERQLGEHESQEQHDGAAPEHTHRSTHACHV